jgi:hypothetical protein
VLRVSVCEIVIDWVAESVWLAVNACEAVEEPVGVTDEDGVVVRVAEDEGVTEPVADGLLVVEIVMLGVAEPLVVDV